MFEGPFVLCEDARGPAGVARVFTQPRDIVSGWRLSEVAPALARIRCGLRSGLFAAGWLSYDAGAAFEPRLAARAAAHNQRREPLLWFGLFEAVHTCAAADLAAQLPPGSGAWLSAPRPRISRADYEAAFARVQRYLRAGDVYQVNLSYRADIDVLGHPLAAYALLREAGRGGWSGAVHTGAEWLLSTSPELFFRLEQNAIEARPMKGTAPRASDLEEDRAASERLRTDAKERAENLMIVDLLRNDISRLAKRGSVRVPALFSLETYPTLHALTSTVRAELREGCDALDALAALFPCGSITGAPKIRAMEIIAELESSARGAYSGSIGWIGPEGESEFNVAIRTLALRDGAAELGVGSAIVLDSTAEKEWAECQAKSAFVTAGAPAFDLIETMRAEPGSGVWRLDLHLQRLERSANVFGFAFDRGRVAARLREALAPIGVRCIARLTLSRDGGVDVSLRDFAPAERAFVVAAAPLPVPAHDFRLAHKTTLRGFYDAARAASGADEVVFADQEGFITEGSFSNVFVARGDMLVTPPLARGLLPGVLRTALLQEHRAVEGDLRVEDLAGGFFIGNAARGLISARLAPGGG